MTTFSPMTTSNWTFSLSATDLKNLFGLFLIMASGGHWSPGHCGERNQSFEF